MKKKYILLFSLGLILIIIPLLFKQLNLNNKGTLENNNKATVSNANNKLVNKVTFDILSVIPGGINIKSNYNDIIKLYGKPIDIKKLTDENLINQKGYFVNLVYKDKEIIMYCYDKEVAYNLNKNNEIIQIDYYGNNVTLNGKIKIGDKYNDIYKEYKTDNIDSKYIDTIKKILNKFKKDNTYEVYNKLLSISTSDPNTIPITMVLLFNEDNLLERISYIYPTAD
jgi:hypothetical protein